MSDAVEHEHALRAAGGAPLIFSVSVPAGQWPEWWQPPTETPTFQFGDVEYLIDGVVVAGGSWPMVRETVRKGVAAGELAA